LHRISVHKTPRANARGTEGFVRASLAKLIANAAVVSNACATAEGGAGGGVLLRCLFDLCDFSCFFDVEASFFASPCARVMPEL